MSSCLFQQFNLDKSNFNMGMCLFQQFISDKSNFNMGIGYLASNKRIYIVLHRLIFPLFYYIKRLEHKSWHKNFPCYLLLILHFKSKKTYCSVRQETMDKLWMYFTILPLEFLSQPLCGLPQTNPRYWAVIFGNASGILCSIFLETLFTSHVFFSTHFVLYSRVCNSMTIFLTAHYF